MSKSWMSEDDREGENPIALYIEEIYPEEDDPAIAALKAIRNREGKVCDNFELCDHRACNSSYSAWAIADEALARLLPP